MNRARTPKSLQRLLSTERKKERNEELPFVYRERKAEC